MTEENPVANVLGRKAIDEDELEDFEFEKDTSPRYITATVGRVAKARRYISDPSEAPEGVEVEEGPQGGYYYETGGTGEADIRDEPEDIEGVEVDGVNVAEGTEFEWEDGSTVTVEGVYEDEDGEVQVSISDESTDATSVHIDDIAEQMDAGNLTPVEEGDIDTGGETESHEETDGDAEEGDPGAGASDDGETLWEAELATNYDDGDTVTVETERQGEITGTIEEHDWIDEYGELILVGDDGEEYYIPTEDIEGLE